MDQKALETEQMEDRISNQEDKNLEMIQVEKRDTSFLKVKKLYQNHQTLLGEPTEEE